MLFRSCVRSPAAPVTSRWRPPATSKSPMTCRSTWWSSTRRSAPRAAKPAVSGNAGCQVASTCQRVSSKGRPAHRRAALSSSVFRGCVRESATQGTVVNALCITTVYGCRLPAALLDALPMGSERSAEHREADDLGRLLRVKARGRIESTLASQGGRRHPRASHALSSARLQPLDIGSLGTPHGYICYRQ